MPSAAALTMPDLYTEPDMLLPSLDESLLLSRPIDLGLDPKDNDPMNWTSQVVSDPISIEQPRNAPEERPELYDDDLDLTIDINDGPSIERGRDAPPPRSVGDDLIGDDDKFRGQDDLNLNFDDDEPIRTRLSTEPAPVQDNEGPLPDTVGGMNIEDPDNFAFTVNDATADFANPADQRLQRTSQSPLSSVRSSVVRDLDATMFDLEEEALIHHAHKAKKRRVLQVDADTVLNNQEIKRQQQDRSAILKPASFLPRDPVLLTLMNMQRNGSFVSGIMNNGYAQGWAPELRGILSIEVVRRSGELKRKRDSGIADVDEEDEEEQLASKFPQLEIPEDDDLNPPDDNDFLGGDRLSPHHPTSIIDLPAADDSTVAPRALSEEGVAHPPPLSDEEPLSPLPDVDDTFDDTTAPLVHPIDQGPVSLGTQHAVHLIRDRFGSSASGTPSQQKSSKNVISFQDLLPESMTSRADATKMFFEVLVLATKDAIKVEQADGELGLPIRVRGKRGLWGAWAEREAGGEIAEQREPAAV